MNILSLDTALGQTKHRAAYAKLSEEEKKAYRKAYNKQWLKDNPGYDTKWRQEYWTNDPAARLLWAAKKRAKAKGLPFNLEKIDIIIPKYCPYLELELIPHAPRGQDRSAVISLDRVIPELGYVKGNVEVISQQANTMKNNATKEQLIRFSKHVIEKFSDYTLD